MRRTGVAAALLLVLSTPTWDEAREPPGTHPVTPSPLSGGGGASAGLPASYLGVSLEFTGVGAYAGADGGAVNPVLVQLIRNLAPGQRPVLRIGGNSTDGAWWPVRGVTPPPGASYRLTPAWLRTTRALTRGLGARVILGVNLAMNQPALAAAEARAFISEIGRASVAALEIGNEGDIYARFPRYRSRGGRLRHVRRRSYSFRDFTREFSRMRRALPSVPTAGPAFGNLGWMLGLRRFLTLQRGIGIVTVHRYPLSCFAPRGSPRHPAIANLMSEGSSRGLAEGMTAFVAIAHARGLQFRVDELNSVACGGVRGVSDTFASALWALDTLFEMARVGVDGVNVHTLPGVPYEPFTFTRRGGSWRAFVHPEYYGLLMFAQAAPPGSRLLGTSGSVGGHVKLWATLAPDQAIRFVLINKGGSSARVALARPPGFPETGTLEQLTAPSLAATRGVSIDGQSFGAATGTGTLTGRRVAGRIRARAGRYVVTLPPASATMLTVCGVACPSRVR